MHHPSEKSGGLKTFVDNDEDHQPFPTLERALSVIDTHAGKVSFGYSVLMISWPFIRNGVVKLSVIVNIVNSFIVYRV